MMHAHGLVFSTKRAKAFAVSGCPVSFVVLSSARPNRVFGSYQGHLAGLCLLFLVHR